MPPNDLVRLETQGGNVTLETEWITKHEVGRDCERSVGEVRPRYFQQVSNFEDETLLRGEDCNTRVLYFPLNCFIMPFCIIKPVFY